MNIDQIAHAIGEVARGSVVHHFDMPGFTRVDKWPCRCADIRNRNDQAGLTPPGSAFIEANHGTHRISLFGIEVKHIFHPGNIGQRYQ